MKFTKKEHQLIKVDWKDGAILHIRKAYVQDTMSSKIEGDSQAQGVNLFQKSIVGWENIVDEKDEEIPFSETMRSLIFEDIILNDSFMFDKLRIALMGSLGNSKAGLTAPSNGDGKEATVDNASEKID